MGFLYWAADTKWAWDTIRSGPTDPVRDILQVHTTNNGREENETGELVRGGRGRRRRAKEAKPRSSQWSFFTEPLMTWRTHGGFGLGLISVVTPLFRYQTHPLIRDLQVV